MKFSTINKAVLVAMLITLVSVSSVFAWNQGRCGRQTRDADTGPQRATALTTEQEQQLVTLRQQFIDDTAALRINLNEKMRNLDILLETSNPDKKAVKTLIQDVSELKAALMEKGVNHQLEVRKIAPELGRGKCFRGSECGGGYGRMSGDCGPDCGPGPCRR